MAIFQDWVDEIIRIIPKEMPNIKSTWPYSGFIDWGNGTTPPGYLPFLWIMPGVYKILYGFMNKIKNISI